VPEKTLLICWATRGSIFSWSLLPGRLNPDLWTSCALQQPSHNDRPHVLQYETVGEEWSQPWHSYTLLECANPGCSSGNGSDIGREKKHPDS
jgi:hypothetical protein